MDKEFVFSWGVERIYLFSIFVFALMIAPIALVFAPFMVLRHGKPLAYLHSKYWGTKVKS